MVLPHSPLASLGTSIAGELWAGGALGAVASLAEIGGAAAPAGVVAVSAIAPALREPGSGLQLRSAQVSQWCMVRKRRA